MHVSLKSYFQPLSNKTEVVDTKRKGAKTSEVHKKTNTISLVGDYN